MKEIVIPLVVLNFEAYPYVFGEKGIRLAKIAQKVSEKQIEFVFHHHRK